MGDLTLLKTGMSKDSSYMSTKENIFVPNNININNNKNNNRVASSILIKDVVQKPVEQQQANQVLDTEFSEVNFWSRDNILIEHDQICCSRLIALDIFDDVERRRKIIRCFKSLESSSGAINASVSLAWGGAVSSVVLTGEWYEVAVAAGDIFHVVDIGSDGKSIFSSSVSKGVTALSSFSSGSSADLSDAVEVEISDEKGLFILHPDLLVSPTKISESVTCTRRSVLSDRFRFVYVYFNHRLTLIRDYLIRDF